MDRFLSVGGGSSDVLFGIPIFGNRYGKTRWFKSTVWPAYRVARKFHDARLWFVYRFTRRGRSWWAIYPDLKPGYHDPLTLMLHGCMKVLEQYVEEEGGAIDLAKWTQDLREPGAAGHGPQEAVDRQADKQQTALDILHWWKVEKPADEKRERELLHRLYGNREMMTRPLDNGMVEWLPPQFTDDEEKLYAEHRALEDKIADDEQRMLHRLIDIRQGLWT